MICSPENKINRTFSLGDKMLGQLSATILKTTTHPLQDKDERSMQHDMTSHDEFFMQEALKEARKAAAIGEVPIGAVVVHGDKIVARAHNRREIDRDPSAHAEFSALLKASQVLGRWRLSGCTVYVTLEPCIMCTGLMVNSRIDRCVYGASDPKGGALGTLFDLSHDDRLNHEFEVVSGVCEDECRSLLQDFFSQLRAEIKARKKHS